MFTRSSRHYQGITTSFYSICIVLGTVCVNPLSAVPESTVSGHVGSTAVLPCELESEDTGTPYIKWEIGSETVFERLGEEIYQSEGYEGRVDVPEEELRKGNCSLVLRNLKLTDAAVYTSYQRVRRTKRSVEIEIVEISRVYLSVDADQHHETDLSDTQQSVGPALCGIIIIILSCVCAVFVSISIICSSLYCSTLQDKCSSTEDSNEKEVDLHRSDLTSVTYTSVS